MSARKVLIIEDDPDLVRLLEILIGQLGFETLVANDIDGSLELVMRESPAMILLDISLPSGSGLYLLDELQNSSCANIPVLILSAHDPEVYESKCQAAGAAGYLQKPVDFMKLEKLLQLAV